LAFQERTCYNIGNSFSKLETDCKLRQTIEGGHIGFRILIFIGKNTYSILDPQCSIFPAVSYFGMSTEMLSYMGLARETLVYPQVSATDN
jgi:hypothetical protein